MNIVYALTSDYICKAIPSMTSLLEHNPKAKIYLLTEQDDVDLPFDVNVINITNQKWFSPKDPNYFNMFTYINLLKVCYASILPCNKVIHLDADTIICDSLEPLWKTDIKGKWFAACPEHKGQYKPFGDLYYNMGVALINLAQIRKDGIEARMVEYLNSVPQPWADQDAWNIYAIEQDMAVPIDVRFNESHMTGMTNNPAIVHYCGLRDWYENKFIPRREYLDKYL